MRIRSASCHCRPRRLTRCVSISNRHSRDLRAAPWFGLNSEDVGLRPRKIVQSASFFCPKFQNFHQEAVERVLVPPRERSAQPCKRLLQTAGHCFTSQGLRHSKSDDDWHFAYCVHTDKYFMRHTIILRHFSHRNCVRKLGLSSRKRLTKFDSYAHGQALHTETVVASRSNIWPTQCLAVGCASFHRISKPPCDGTSQLGCTKKHLYPTLRYWVASVVIEAHATASYRNCRWSSSRPRWNRFRSSCLCSVLSSAKSISCVCTYPP